MQPFSQGIDGHQLPRRRFRLVFQRLDLRVRHLPAVAMIFWFARDQYPLAGLEPLADPRLIEPDRSQKLIPLADQHPQHRSAAASIAQFHFIDHAHYAGRPALFQLVDVANVGQILVAARKQKHQVADRGHT